MPQVASIRSRSIQAESLSAATDRLANLALRQGVIGKAAGSFKVSQDTGANMQVKVGSGSPYDRAVVEGDVAGQGTYIVEHDNASQTLPVAASDPTLPRKDIVVLRVYDDTFDSSGNSYADVEVVQGTPNVSPQEPAVPSSAVKLAVVDVPAASTAVVDGNITDSRIEAPTRGQLVDVITYTASGTFAKADYPWLRRVRVRAWGGGGGGGNAAAASVGNHSVGSGGGSGGYGEKWVDADDLAAVEAVTVGAGGVPGGNGTDSVFGAHLTAFRGVGGSSRNNEALAFGVAGGSGGGVSSGADVAVPGSPGGMGWGQGTLAVSGAGGGSGGAGNSSPSGSASIPGAPGQRPGGGGGGGQVNSGGSAASGGVGGPGLVVVEVFA